MYYQNFRNTLGLPAEMTEQHRPRLLKKPTTMAEIPKGYSAMTAITEIIFHGGTLKF